MFVKSLALMFGSFCLVLNHACNAAAAAQEKPDYTELMAQAVNNYRYSPDFPRAARIALFEKAIQADPTNPRNVEATYYTTLLLSRPELGKQFDDKATAAYRQGVKESRSLGTGVWGRNTYLCLSCRYHCRETRLRGRNTYLSLFCPMQTATRSATRLDKERKRGRITVWNGSHGWIG